MREEAEEWTRRTGLELDVRHETHHPRHGRRISRYAGRAIHPR